MIFCDSHLHTDFSTDSEAPVEAQMMRAIELGLKHMYFTDHMDVDFPGGQFVTKGPAAVRRAVIHEEDLVVRTVQVLA